jgi:hypothetical protein
VKSRRSLVGVGIAALSAIWFAVAATPASADGPPFVDSNAQGKIGFCDKNNKPVTSGSIKTVPFVWKYVSDTRAPKGYVGPPQGATPIAFSPIKNTSPGDWNGYNMAATSQYKDPTRPAAVATFGDAPLDWQLGSFPPTFDGLVQVRLILTRTNTQPRTRNYPAALIRVSGDTWTLVDGDRSPDCSAPAVNQAALLLPSKVPTAAPSWASAGASPNGNGNGGATGPSDGGSSQGASPSESVAALGPDGAAISASSAIVWAGVGGLLLLLLGGGIGAYIVGRRPPS